MRALRAARHQWGRCGPLPGGRGQGTGTMKTLRALPMGRPTRGGDRLGGRPAPWGTCPVGGPAGEGNLPRGGPAHLCLPSGPCEALACSRLTLH